MTKKMFIYAYSNKSKSAKLLKEALGCKFILHENSEFTHSPDKVVINCGAGEIKNPEVLKNVIFNHPDKVAISCDKIQTFLNFDATPKWQIPRVVPWTTDKAMAKGWLSEGYTVVARTDTESYDGKGIVIVGPDEGPSTFPDAHLYTKYVPKDTEWRLYYAFDKLIDVLRKVCPEGHTPPTWKVRTEANGFVYTRKSSVPCPQDCVDQAYMAYKKSGLDFCGVDVIFNKHLNQAFVLETNTAPGIVGKTVEYFANAFKSAIA